MRSTWFADSGENFPFARIWRRECWAKLPLKHKCSPEQTQQSRSDHKSWFSENKIFRRNNSNIFWSHGAFVRTCSLNTDLKGFLVTKDRKVTGHWPVELIAPMKPFFLTGGLIRPGTLTGGIPATLAPAIAREVWVAILLKPFSFYFSSGPGHEAIFTSMSSNVGVF